MTQGSGRPNMPKPNGPAGDNRRLKTKAKIEFIKTINSVKNEDEEVEAVHMFKITNKNINKAIRVFPVCPDEYGNMTIKETKNSKLPVSIELDFIHGDTSGIEAKQGNNGSFIITAPKEQYDINIKVKAITDCRYAIDIKS